MRYAASALIASALLALTSAGRVPRTCQVSKAVIPLPPGQTNLTRPAHVRPVFIAEGTGTQNYSCTAARTYTSIGAVAVLIDASCPRSQSYPDAYGGPPHHNRVLGHHYFITNPVPGGTGLSPVFDFRGEAGGPSAFVVTAKAGDILAPADPAHNVDWLELAGVPGHGALAKYVFRIKTQGGQPPTVCTPGSESIEVPYNATYWFFK